jgi:hypothetical protein
MILRVLLTFLVRIAAAGRSNAGVYIFNESIVSTETIPSVRPLAI